MAKRTLADHSHARVAFNLWISHPQLSCQNVQFRFCVGQGNTCLQVSIYNTRGYLAVLQALACAVAYEWPCRDRGPENGHSRERAKVVHRRHTYDCESHSVKVNRGAYDGGV